MVQREFWMREVEVLSPPHADPFHYSLAGKIGWDGEGHDARRVEIGPRPVEDSGGRLRRVSLPPGIFPKRQPISTSSATGVPGKFVTFSPQ